MRRLSKPRRTDQAPTRRAWERSPAKRRRLTRPSVPRWRSGDLAHVCRLGGASPPTEFPCLCKALALTQVQLGITRDLTQVHSCVLCVQCAREGGSKVGGRKVGGRVGCALRILRWGRQSYTVLVCPCLCVRATHANICGWVRLGLRHVGCELCLDAAITSCMPAPPQPPAGTWAVERGGAGRRVTKEFPAVPSTHGSALARRRWARTSCAPAARR